MEKKTYRVGVDGDYRRFAFRVVSSFRTVSADVALVIAGMMPLMMMLVEAERRKYLTSQRTAPVHSNQVTDDLTNRWQYEKKSILPQREDGPTEFQIKNYGSEENVVR